MRDTRQCRAWCAACSWPLWQYYATAWTQHPSEVLNTPHHRSLPAATETLLKGHAAFVPSSRRSIHRGRLACSPNGSFQLHAKLVNGSAFHHKPHHSSSLQRYSNSTLALASPARTTLTAFCWQCALETHSGSDRPQTATCFATALLASP